MVKNLLQCGRPGCNPWVGKIPWRKELPAPVFLPGEFHGQRSLADYSPWAHKESSTTERLTHFMAEARHHAEPDGKDIRKECMSMTLVQWQVIF